MAQDLVTDPNEVQTGAGLSTDVNDNAGVITPDDGKPSSKKEKLAEDFAKVFMDTYTLPAVAESMMNKDKYKEIYGDAFIQKFGSKTKANEEMDKQYEMISKAYQNVASENQKFKVLENIAHNISNQSDVDIVEIGSPEISGDIRVMPETITGEKMILDSWTPSTRSLREAALDQKVVIDKNGNFIPFKENPYDEIAHEDAYADENGNQIKAFTYYIPAQEKGKHARVNGLAIKAVYEGEDPVGELVSRYDTANWFLKGNTLDTSVFKVAVGSVFDFIVDTADSMLALIQYQTQLYTLGYAEKMDWYQNGLKDWRTALQTAQTSSSDADTEEMITTNNMVSLGINIAGQLLSGKALASGMAWMLKVGTKYAGNIVAAEKGLEKARALLSTLSGATAGEKAIAEKSVKLLTKKVDDMKRAYNRNQNIVKRSTLIYMGSLQAKETGDTARANGFSETEAALIYFASLGTLALANKISNLGFENLGLNVNKKIVKGAVDEVMTGITPTTGGIMSVITKNNTIANKIYNKLNWVLSNEGLAAGAAREALEENTEFLFDEIVRHTATALSTLGYGTDGPKFQTAFDKGYWDYFNKQVIMNTIAGAGAGAGVSFVTNIRNKGKNKEEDVKLDWPQHGKTAEVFKYIGYHSTRNGRGVMLEQQLDSYLKKSRKKGWLGREDLATAWDDKNKRYKRTDELTDADRANGHTSQAELMENTIRLQYEFYKSAYAGSSKTLKELQEENPDLGFLFDTKTAYEEMRTMIDKKRSLYNKAAGGNSVDFDTKLNSIRITKSKLKPDKDGKIDDSKYREEMKELTGATQLSESEIEELITINSVIEDLKNGNALEKLTLKYHLRDKDLSYDKLYALIKADKIRQDEFEKYKEAHDEERKRMDDLVDSVLDTETNKVDVDFLSHLAGSTDRIPMSETTRNKLILAISNMGVPIEEQKKRVLRKMLDDLKISVSNVGKGIFVDKENSNIDKKDDALAFVHSLEQSIEEGSDQFLKALNGITKLNISRKTDESEDRKEIDRFAYVLNRMINMASGVNSTESMKSFVYDFEKIVEDKDGSYYVNNLSEDLRIAIDLAADYDFHQDFNRLPLLDPEGHQGLISLFKHESSDPIEDILDPYNSKEALPDVGATKKQLISILANTVEYAEGSVRNDLMYGYSTDDNGNIISTDIQLEERYKTLISGSTDKDGNVVFFTDGDGAKNLLDQINTRIEEVKFLLEFLPVLVQVDSINKNKLGIEEGSDNAFFTQYLEKYLVTMDQFIASPKAVEMKLNSYLGELLGLQEKANKLLDKAANASVDLKEAYAKNAVEISRKDLTDIADIFDSEPFKEHIKDTEYSAKIADIEREIRRILDVIKDTSNDSVKKIYETVASIKNQLNKLYTDSIKNGESEFLNLIVSYLKSKSYDDHATNEKILRFVLSNSEELNARVKSVISAISTTSNEDLVKAKLPTAEQLIWVETMVLAATNSDFLGSMKKISGNSRGEVYDSAMFFSSAQGTGKTAVAFKIAAEIIQSMSPITSKIMISAAHEVQSRNMLNSLSGTNVSVADINKTKTQYELYKELVNTGNVNTADAFLNDVSVIFYDEIGTMEYDGDNNVVKNSKKGNPQDYPTLNGILAMLELVNAKRASENRSPVILIGIGDANQPGYIAGTPSPKNPDGKDFSLDSFKETNPLFTSNLVVSGAKLTTNFRSQRVPGMTPSVEAAKQTFGLWTRKFNGFTYNFIPTTNTHLGINIEDEPGSFNDKIANNEQLINSIVANMTADETFTLAIVLGEGKKFDNNLLLEDTHLKRKILDHPVLSKRVTPYTIDTVQGSEATYVLAHINEGFFGVLKPALDGKSDLDQDTKNKLIFRKSRLFMLLGRAYQYTHISHNDSILGSGGYLSSTQDNNLNLLNTGETVEFKKNWLSLLNDGILVTSKTVSPGVTTNVNTPTEIPQFKVDADNINQSDYDELISIVVDEINNNNVSNSELKTTYPGLYEKLYEMQNINKLASEEEVVSEEYVKFMDELDSIVRNNNKNKTVAAEEIKNNGLTITKEEQASLGPVVHPSAVPEAKFAGDSYIENEIKNVIFSIAEKYEIPKPKEITEDFMSNLIKALDMSGRSRDKFIVQNVRDYVLNRNSFPEESDLLETGLDENMSTPKDQNVTTDKDFMRNVEIQNRLVTAFQDIQSRNNNIEETRVNYTKQIYGSKVIEDKNLVRDIVINDENGNLKIDTDNYDFYFVTFSFTDGNTEKYNNVIVAKDKVTGNAIILAQFGLADDYDLSKKNSFGSLIGERISTLKGDTDIKDSVQYQGKTKFIESKISNIESVIVGLTVGNLVTSDSYSVANLKTLPDLANLKDGKLSGESRIYTPEFLELQTLAKNTFVDGTSWNYEAFVDRDMSLSPFKLYDEKAFIRNLGDDHYVVVKTSIGPVAFLIRDTGDAIPIIGFKDGIIVSDTLNNGELKLISEKLRGLKSQLANEGSEFVKNIESSAVEADLDTIYDIDIETRKQLEDSFSAKDFLTEKFMDRPTGYLGDKKITVYSAINEVWGKTSKPVSTSRPFVLTRGKHAGRTVMFYTFNKGTDLGKMSEEDMLKLYKKMRINIANMENPLSINRLGIGMILLDNKPTNLSKLFQNFETTKPNVSKVDFNKSIMTKESERKLISLFSTLHLILNQNSSSFEIAKILSNDGLISNLKDKIEELRKTNPAHVNTLSKLLESIFDIKNLGRIALTTKASPELIDALDEINRANISPDVDIEAKYNEIFEKYKSQFSDIGVNKAGDLKFLVGQTHNSDSATGKVYSDNNNLVVLTELETVIRAINSDWLNRFNANNGSNLIAPDPSFDLYNLFRQLSKIVSASDIDLQVPVKSYITEVLGMIDGLLADAGLPYGLTVSPTIKDSSAPIAPVDNLLQSELFTDVKRIRSPQLVLDVDKLILNEENVVRSKSEIDEKTKEREKYIEDMIVKAQNPGVNKQQLESLLSDATKKLNNNIITAEEFSLIENAIYSKFNSSSFPTTDLTSIDFNDFILTTNEEVKKSLVTLNDLAKLSTTQVLADAIFQSLVIPDSLHKSQGERILGIVTKLKSRLPESDKQSNELSKKTFSEISNAYKKSTLSTISFVVNNEETIGKIDAIINALTSTTTTFPQHIELSMEERILLLLGLNAIKPDGSPFVSNLQKDNTSLTQALTKNPETAESSKLVNNWVKKALTIGKTQLVIVTPEVDSILNEQSGFANRDTKDISKAFTELFHNKNYEGIFKLLESFMTELNSIYYNSTRKKDFATAILNFHQTLSTIADSEVWIENDQRIREFLMEVEAEETNNILKSFEDSILTDKAVTKLKELDYAAYNLFSQFVTTIPDEAKVQFAKHINQDFTQDEMQNQVPAKNITAIVSALVAMADTSVPKVSKDSVRNIVNTIDSLASNEEFKCFV